MTLDLDLVARCRKYGTNFQDHYLRHLFEYNFPMPYADDFKKAPLYKEIGEGPRNVAEERGRIPGIQKIKTTHDINIEIHNRKPAADRSSVFA